MNSFAVRTAMLLVMAAFVLTSPLPMDVGSGAIQPWDTEQPSIVTGATDRYHRLNQSPLPKVVRYTEPDSRPLLVKAEAKIKAKLSLSSFNRELSASDRAMERMIKSRPKNGNDIHEDVLAITQRPQKVIGLEAIKLPESEAQSSQALAVMTRKGNSFFAQDKRGRVWLFEARQNGKYGKHFTYTGNLKGGNNELVRQKLGENGKQILDAAEAEFANLKHTLSAPTFVHGV